MKSTFRTLMTRSLTGLAALGLAFSVMTSCDKKAKDDDWDPVNAPIEGESVLDMTLPPEVPPPVDPDRPATKYIINMEVIEENGEIADGVQYNFWTFGGSVPGKFIRVREGDLVEFHLQNHPNNKFAHNIDLHAVTGPGGGATSSFTAPGHESIFSFKVINPGLYVYHCATAPVGMHIANGMYGLILVEPKEGLRPVDKEYYVMQGDFYTEGGYGEGGLQSFDMEKALEEDAEYVVFNGRVNSLTGDRALTANVGETVRLFVGNGGPNLVSSFHVIGEIFDKVYVEGGDLINDNIQTTLIPAGGAAIVEFKVEVPGTFILVDHSIFRAFNKGALAQLTVNGKENIPVYSGKQDDRIYQIEGGIVQKLPGEDKPEAPTEISKEEKMTMGRNIYKESCQACHQADGMGIPGAFPPLASSSYFKGDHTKLISPIVNGLEGKITVNGEEFNSVMPIQTLTDVEISAVATYVLNTWNNEGGEVKASEVAAVRKKK